MFFFLYTLVLLFLKAINQIGDTKYQWQNNSCFGRTLGNGCLLLTVLLLASLSVGKECCKKRTLILNTKREMRCSDEYNRISPFWSNFISSKLPPFLYNTLRCWKMNPQKVSLARSKLALLQWEAWARDLESREGKEAAIFLPNNSW